jgi:preprotein translocase subunit SecF
MKLNIIKQQKIWWAISGTAFIASIVAMVISYNTFGAPLKPALDFIGGTRLQLTLECKAEKTCKEPIAIDKVRNILDTEGLGGSSIQVVEDYTVSIRSKTLDAEQRTKIQDSFNQQIGKFILDSNDTVGATIGQDLFISGLKALLLSFFGIIVYLSFRFQFDYAFFAIFALLHDTVITAGIFAILGLVGGVEVDSLFLVSLLTIVGFSVNDTVVIYDRIRETSEKATDESIDEIVDAAVNQTLGRSINTTLTTLLPLVAIYIFGGETLKYFALALIVGFIFGAYSSIFIASTLLAWWRNLRNKQNKKVVVGS